MTNPRPSRPLPTEPAVWRKSALGMLAHPVKLVRKLLHVVARSSLVTPRLRVRLHRWRGVEFADPDSVFIGVNVLFDEICPQNIQIGGNVILAEDAKIIAHFYDTSAVGHYFYQGEVRIGDGVFIGMGAVIAAPITVGEGAVVGAGSVVVQDVPPRTVVAGVPARKVGERGERTATYG